MKSEDLDHSILSHIHDKARELENLLTSDVVCYYGDINPGYFRWFRNFIEEVTQKSQRNDDTLSIILRTAGGSAETAERYVTVVTSPLFYRKFYRSRYGNVCGNDILYVRRSHLHGLLIEFGSH